MMYFKSLVKDATKIVILSSTTKTKNTTKFISVPNNFILCWVIPRDSNQLLNLSACHHKLQIQNLK